VSSPQRCGVSIRWWAVSNDRASLDGVAVSVSSGPTYSGVFGSPRGYHRLLLIQLRFCALARIRTVDRALAGSYT
jgi:hypothetical protein